MLSLWKLLVKEQAPANLSNSFSSLNVWVWLWVIAKAAACNYRNCFCQFLIHCLVKVLWNFLQHKSLWKIKGCFSQYMWHADILSSFSFSRLFSSSSNTTKKPEPPVNLKYNAPTSHVTPSVKKRSSTLSQLPGDKSKAFDFLSEE